MKEDSNEYKGSEKIRQWIEAGSGLVKAAAAFTLAEMAVARAQKSSGRDADPAYPAHLVKLWAAALEFAERLKPVEREFIRARAEEDEMLRGNDGYAP